MLANVRKDRASMEELNQKIGNRELRETDVLEDLMRLDYLLD